MRTRTWAALAVSAVATGALAVRGCGLPPATPPASEPARAATAPQTPADASPSRGRAPVAPPAAPLPATSTTPEDPRAVEPRGTVRGVVRDPDGRPAAGARVWLLPAHVLLCFCDDYDGVANYQYIPYRAQKATTDADGRYEFAGVGMGGTYAALAWSERFAFTGHVDAFVPDETPVSMSDLMFARRASLTVTVLAPDGTQVDEADVAVRGSLQFRDEMTRTRGVHRFEGLAPGGYGVLAAKSPWVCAVENVKLAAGENATVTLRLTEGGETLEGVVVDDRGEPVAGATLRARDLDANLFGAYIRTEGEPDRHDGVSEGRAKTGRDGRFCVPGLRSGFHRVEVGMPGHDQEELAVHQVPSTNCSLTLTRHASALMRLVPSGGCPQPEQLTLRYELFPVVGSQRVDLVGQTRTWTSPWNDGLVRFPGLKAFRGTVSVCAEGVAPLSFAINPKPGETLDLGEATLVAAPSEVREATPPRPPATVFRGRVLDKDGRPVREVELALYETPVGARPSPVGSCFTDHRGVFEKPFPPGRYRLGDGDEWRRQTPPAGEEIELVAGETTWIVLRR